MLIHLLKTNSNTSSLSSSSGTFPAVWSSVCLQPIQQRRHAKETLPVNVNCQGSEASPSIAAAKELCGTEPLWGTAESGREEARGPSVALKTCRSHGWNGERESHFPGSLNPSSLPDGVRSPLQNLTSQYFNIEILILSSEHKLLPR